MDKLQLLKFVESPSSINKAVLPKVVESIKKYTYCQSLQLLLVKHLHDVKSNHFESQLSKASVYAGDREHLYNLINDKKGTLENLSSGQKANIPNISTPSNKISTKQPVAKKEEPKQVASVKKQPEEQTPQSIATPKVEHPKMVKTQPSAAKKEELNKLDAEEKKRKLQEQIKQRLAEISNKKSGDNPDEKKKPEQSVNYSNEIIDKFIEKEPRITRRPDEEIPEGDLSKESSENENFISETLAVIYYKQGKHEKAIETYEKLILKFPEKSTYFANQIEEIKQNLNKR